MTFSPAAIETPSQLRVSNNELENAYYRVKINSDGDVASIFDKTINKELLSGPARLAISYDNPEQWPAWNMDWDQEQAPPKAYVSGPARIRVVENGPVRVAIEVSRETLGSRFVQTISLAAGDAGKRVEFANVIDWTTRESNLKATFPLTASNHVATYNWDIGTIERPTAEPKKFEVPSHQWIDLTDAERRIRRNHSHRLQERIGQACRQYDPLDADPNPRHRRRLRRPGTQDIGHHEFTYGIAGHAGGWRDAQTDWQAQRLNAPLIAFQTSKHEGPLGRTFSLLKISNPRIRALAVKKAEDGDEIVIRLVELDGKPQKDVRITFASPITAAREVNGQEEPVGPATVSDGALVTSFHAYQPRTFALKLGAAPQKIAPAESTPVPLHYGLATSTNDGAQSQTGFDGKGNSFPAKMLPSQITFNGVKFELAAAKTNSPNAVTAKGQVIALPQGRHNRLYLLAASSNGDQKSTFEIGANRAELTIEDWSGFIGQWNDREWSSKDTSHDAMAT